MFPFKSPAKPEAAEPDGDASAQDAFQDTQGPGHIGDQGQSAEPADGAQEHMARNNDTGGPADPEPADVAEIPDTDTPLTGHVSPEDIDAAAERFTVAAAALADRAGRYRAEAARIRADLQAEIARLTAIAEAAAAPLDGSAADDDAKVASLAEPRRVLGIQAGPEGTARKAERADARVAELRAERERLEAQGADLGGRLANLAARRQEADSRRAAALDSEDLAEMADQIALAAAIDESSRKLAGDRDAARARLAEIGDGQLLPTWPQKLLYDAMTQAGNLHRTIEDGLNWIWPARPEAVAARERRLDRDAADYAARQRADAARERPQARTIIAR